MTADDLLNRLEALGCRLVVTAGGPRVRKPRGWTEAENARLADLLPLLRLHRDAVLARCSTPGTDPEPEPVPVEPGEVEPWTCDVCDKLICVTPDEWRSVAGSPLFCDRAGAREARGIGGRVVPAVPRCPFKPGDRV